MRKKNLLHASLDQGLVRHGNGIEIEAFACHSKHGTTFFFFASLSLPFRMSYPCKPNASRERNGREFNAMQQSNDSIEGDGQAR